MVNDERHDNRPTGQTEDFPRARWLIVVVVVVLVALLIFDWADPCSGQITDTLGCLAALLETP